MGNSPSKELVRAWLQRRRAQAAPLPSIEQLRRELGWTHEPRPCSAAPAPRGGK